MFQSCPAARGGGGGGALPPIPSLGGAKATFGSPFVTVRFWDMLQALRRGLPDEIFHFGHQLERFEQLDGDGGVVLHFGALDAGAASANAAPTPPPPPQTARFLIDAGGIRSATRKQILNDERIPRLRATFAVVPSERADGAAGSAGGELNFIAGGNLSVVTMSLADGSIMWSQTDMAQTDPLACIVSDEGDFCDTLERLYADWPDDVQRLVSGTTFDDAIETTISELPLSWRWGEGDVTLLGDAAHAQLPALGLGVSTALGDVEELVVQLRRRGLSRGTLRWYERVRIPVCATLQLMSRAMTFLSKFSAAQR